MTPKRILALDAGTHAVRALLLDGRGRRLAAAARPVATQRPAADRFEQDPAAILEASREALAEAAVGERVDRVGIAVQRSSVAFWDARDGAPLAPVIGWQDTRAAAELAALADRSAEIAERTGLRLSPHYGASKLAWAQRELPSVAAAARAGRLVMGPLAAWLVAGLVAGAPRLVDHANASRTLLWNLAGRDWDPVLLQAFGIDAARLPACRPIRHDYGPLAAGGATVTALSGDQNAALFADGPLPEGRLLANLGTGAFALRPLGGEPMRHEHLLCGLADSDAAGATYLLEGTVNGAGAALSWAEARWGLAPVAPRLDALFASGATPCCFRNTVGGLGSPWWRGGPESGPWDGATGEAEIALGAAESVLFLLAVNVASLAAAGPPPEALRVAGGLSRSDALCARLAALSGLPVERPDDPEATARGIAWLAAGGPADWEAAPAARFEPLADPELRGRFDCWLAKMRDLA